MSEEKQGFHDALHDTLAEDGSTPEPLLSYLKILSGTLDELMTRVHKLEEEHDSVR